MISIAPIDAMSATDDPDTPPKMTDETTFTWPMPPGIQPTQASAKSNSFSATWPRSISTPTKMNSGTATSRKEFIAENMLCARRSIGVEVKA